MNPVQNLCCKSASLFTLLSLNLDFVGGTTRHIRIITKWNIFSLCERLRALGQEFFLMWIALRKISPDFVLIIATTLCVSHRILPDKQIKHSNLCSKSHFYEEGNHFFYWYLNRLMGSSSCPLRSNFPAFYVRFCIIIVQLIRKL